MAVGKDKYCNIINVEATESAAGTLTFEEVNVGLNVFDKVGLCIHRIDWHIQTASIDLMTASSDEIRLAISQSNSITGMGINQAPIVDRLVIARLDMGTAASGALYATPWTTDYTDFPGGGILTTPKPLYVGIQSQGLASAATCNVRIWFTTVNLKSDEYFELLESRAYFG